LLFLTLLQPVPGCLADQLTLYHGWCITLVGAAAVYLVCVVIFQQLVIIVVI
jgi:hypothetical protein